MKKAAKGSKKPSAAKRATSASYAAMPESTGKPKRVREVAQSAPLSKQPTNLTLDAEAIERGQAYGKLHGISVSKLVNGFLSALPLPDADPRSLSLSPPVRRLYGVAAGGPDRDDYRAHLLDKYGKR